MRLETEEKSRAKFRNILNDLCREDALKSEEDHAKFVKEFKTLYLDDSGEEKFRHYYSDVYAILNEIGYLSDTGVSKEALGQNIQNLKNYVCSLEEQGAEYVKLSDKINKLYDHISLDIARMNFSIREIKERAAKADVVEVTKRINSLNKMVSENEDKIRNQQREAIAILGIFAAVVLAFTGGIAFSSSVLENINAVSPYRIILIALIIGLVLINAIFGLCYYIGLLVNDTGRIKPLLISNAIICILIALTFVGWKTGVVEKRDAQIENTGVKIVTPIQTE